MTDRGAPESGGPGGERGRGAGTAALVALAVLAALTVGSVLAVLPPPPRPADAPVGEFSAERAFAHVERIAGTPRVAGSGAADDVREYLVATLDGLGVRTEVQDAVGTTAGTTGGATLARVRNVVGVLPGTSSTGRLFLVAHYDSVQTGPGANDDGAGVAALLETVRALSAGPPPSNDVVVVLTDAEEACLCGAEAFVSQHPLAAGGGVVLNLEARGSTGPPIMFETSAGNALLAARYAAAAPHPVATSLAVEVYRRLPNDTDFTPFLAAGFTGLNSAYIDGSALYHTPQDTPDRLDRASLQAHGDNALALARELGAADLAPLAAPAASDATYFPVAGTLARLPGALVWPVAVLGVLAVAFLGWRARGTGVGRLVGGAGLALVPLALGPLAAAGLWWLLVALRPGYREMLDPWQPVPYRLAALALVAAVLLGWYALARRAPGPAGVAFGALQWLAVLGVALAALAPGGSYLGALPALAGGLATAVAVSARRAVTRTALLALAAAAAVLVLAPAVLLFLPALGMAGIAAPAFLATLLGLVVLPVVDPLLPARRSGAAPAALPALPAAACLATALALAATGLAVDRFDARRPAPAQLMYALDTDTGRAWWLSTETDPGAWTSRYVTGREQAPDASPVLDGGLPAGPAPAAPLPAPAVAVGSGPGAPREIRLLLRPQRPARLVAFRVDGVRVVEASVAGRAIDPGAAGDGPFGAVVHAPPPEGVAVTLVLDGSGSATLWVADGSDGLDGLPGFEPRPADVGVAGSHTSELVLVSRSVPLG